MDIVLKNEEPHILEPIFYHATDGTAVSYETKVAVSLKGERLVIDFHCAENPFVNTNTMFGHNEELYNQEVFEVFIASGADDPHTYFEIEINPNNAVWIGKIENPDLGETVQKTVQMYKPDEFGLEFEAVKLENAWQGFLSIPLDGIGHSNVYRINFYRIRSKVEQTDSNWVCSTDNCDFVCWESTLSGENPAFHRPKRFGVLELP